MRFKKLLFLAMVLFIIICCGLHDSPLQAKTNNDRWHWKHHHPEYAKYAKESIKKYGKGLLKTKPADIREYIDSYGELNHHQRIQFWADLLSAISKLESNYDPHLAHVEDFKNRLGQPVVSRGLFQLSIESVKQYGCKVNCEADLDDAKTNIECATIILNKWVSKDKTIGGRKNTSRRSWKGGARYWSVLRNNENTSKIKSYMHSIEDY